MKKKQKSLSGSKTHYCVNAGISCPADTLASLRSKMHLSKVLGPLFADMDKDKETIILAKCDNGYVVL